MIIFKIIGMFVVGLFVFVFIAAFVGQFWLKSKFKKIIEQAKQNSPHGPARGPGQQPIDIEPDQFLSLVKRSYADVSDAVSSLRNEVSSLGFKEFNVYEIPEMPFSAILASHREDGLFAVIYDAENSAHYDLIAKSKTGAIYTVSNSDKDYRAVSGEQVFKKLLPNNESFSKALEFLQAEKSEDLQILKQSNFEGILLQSYQN